MKTINYNNYININLGFSLIELSIVLIIIGLLVAGITSGSSLIESAKIRAFVNESNNYKTAINTFYLARGRLPSDKYNKGCFGYGENADDFICGSSLEQSFEELYDEGILDFDAKVCDTWGKDCDDVNMPKSRIFKDGRYEYNNSIDTSWDMTLFENALNVLIFNPDDNYTVFDYKLAKRIDQIIDDGIAKSGKFRALVGSTVGDIEYDDIDGIDCNGEDKNLCSAYELVFKLDLDK